MPTVLLQKDDAEKLSQSYVVGEHVLGRGNKLQCTSKKVSRNHGVLKVTKDEGIFLRSTHNNPCFYKPQQSEKVSLVTFGNTLKINHNDKIALSLDHGWFIVQVKDNDDNTDENQANTSLNNENDDPHETYITEMLKRAIEEADETPAKKLKPDTSTSDETLPSDVVIKSEPVDEAPSSSKTNSTTIEVKQEPVEIPTSEVNLNTSSSNNSTNIYVKQEPGENLTSEVDFNAVEVKIEPVSQTEDDCKKENDEAKDDSEKECKKEKDDCKDDKPSTSGTNKKPWRDRCWYGSACYRKNGAHRVQLKHPGDSDYDSDADDTRPVCCYGADCYRKNREHRKRYRHPGQTKLGAKPAPLPPKRRVRPPPNQMSQDSEELDDYDYSDPFLDDGSEDEYEPSQNTDTESEYEDSQEAEEDHKRLLKEARKFTRNQK